MKTRPKPRQTPEQRKVQPCPLESSLRCVATPASASARAGQPTRTIQAARPVQVWPHQRGRDRRYLLLKVPSDEGAPNIRTRFEAEGVEEWRALEQLVSDLSEKAYYATWMGNAEFEVWRLATEGGSWGRIDSEDSADQLKEALAISRSLGVWVVMDDETGFVKPIPVEAWLRAYERWRAGIPPGAVDR